MGLVSLGNFVFDGQIYSTLYYTTAQSSNGWKILNNVFMEHYMTTIQKKQNKCGVNNYIILEWQIRKSLKSKESLLWSILTLHNNSTRFDQSRVII